MKFIRLTQNQVHHMHELISIRLNTMIHYPEEWESIENLSDLYQDLEAGLKAYSIDQLKWMRDQSTSYLETAKKLKQENRKLHLDHYNSCCNLLNKLNIATKSEEELAEYKLIR